MPAGEKGIRFGNLHLQFGRGGIHINRQPHGEEEQAYEALIRIPVQKTPSQVFYPRLSPTLKGTPRPESTSQETETPQNPNVVLDPRRELALYFSRQTPLHRQAVRELAAQINEPPSRNLRAMVCIPVAGHQEGKNIYQALLNYSQQDCPRDQFELVLFVNYPKTDREGRPIKPDNTRAEIERFKKNFPNFPIRIIEKQLSLDEANIGTIRKYVTDVALYRQKGRLERGETDKDIILISNDGDNKGIAPQYISNFIRRFDENPSADGMLGQLDWDPEAYAENPLVHIGTRLFQYLSIRGRHISGRMPSSGANFAFRGSIYAAVGGYIPNINPGEDVALGQAITFARQDHHVIQFAGARVSRVYTSARRAIDALKSGLSPVRQWDKGFSAFDNAVRSIQVGNGKEIDYNDQGQLVALKTGLEMVINDTLNVYEGGERLGKGAHVYRSTLARLGIRYHVVEDQPTEENSHLPEYVRERVVISDMSQLVENLRVYQKIGRIQRDIKSGHASTRDLRFLQRVTHERYSAEMESSRKREREMTRERRQTTKKLKRLERTIQQDLPTAPRRYTMAELSTSKSQEIVGEFTICLDKPLKSESGTTAFAGYDQRTGRVYAFEEIRPEERAYIAKANNYPQGVTDPESLFGDAQRGILSLARTTITAQDKDYAVRSLAGMTLQEYMRSQGKLDPVIALATTIKIAQGVKEMHQHGVMHLDLGPASIEVSPKGIRITNLKTASVANKGTYTRGFEGGNRYTMPPELFTAPNHPHPNADMYEVGVLLYHMLTADYPFHSSTGSSPDRIKNLYEAHVRGEFSIPDSVPKPIQAILRKAITPNPSERYQNTDEMLFDLVNAYELEGRSSLLHKPAKQRARILSREVSAREFPVFRQFQLTDTSRPSDTLANNPQAQLNPEAETANYFGRQSPEYSAQLRALSGQIKERMDRQAEVVVCMPVAGAQEAKNIYRTIESYSHQTLDPSKFELLLLVNASATVADARKADIEATMAELERAKKDFPQINVRVASIVVPDNQVRIGNLRKIVTDLALLRTQEARIGRDVLLLSNDADNMGISPRYLEAYTRYFAEHPEKDGAVGNLQFDPSSFIRFPALGAGIEFTTLLDQQGFRNSSVTLFGSNSVMKSSVYAAIGGYPPALRGGEQEWTGDTVRTLRQTKQTLGFVEDGLLTTSPRRLVLSYLQNPAEQDPTRQIVFGDEASEERMRTLDINSLPIFDFGDPEKIRLLQSAIEMRLNTTINLYENGEKLGKSGYLYKTALQKMGIEYRVEGDPASPSSRIIITDMSRFIERQQKIRRIIESGETNMARVFMRLDEPEEVAPIPGIEEELTTFNQHERVTIPDMPPLRYTLDELRESQQTETEGDYVLCLDKRLRETSPNVIAGYNARTGQVMVFKKSTRQQHQQIAHANMHPDGVLLPEDVIKETILEPHLQPYEVKIEHGDEIIRGYPLDVMDLQQLTEKSGRKLTERQAVGISIEVAEGLRALHQHNMAHFDVSSSNILFDQQGHVHLTDFDGIAYELPPSSGRKFYGGNVYIQAPELYENNLYTAKSIDIYEATILLYEMFVGRNPFSHIPWNSGEPDEVRRRRFYEAHKNADFPIPANTPSEMANIFRKGLEPDPKKRYQSMDEMLHDLMQAYQHLPRTN